jgi:hypothetical protein
MLRYYTSNCLELKKKKVFRNASLEMSECLCGCVLRDWRYFAGASRTSKLWLSRMSYAAQANGMHAPT